MSKEPETDPDYINVLRRRKLHHAEKRGKFFDAAWDSLTTVDMEHELRRKAQYHRGCEHAISEIIDELIAPDEREQLMNDNDETRSYTRLLADNKQLHESNQLLQLRLAEAHVIIADYERTHAVIETGKPQSRTVYKEFYCCECFHQQHGIPCKPEDGAIMGTCPKCDKQMTLIHGNHAKRTTS